MRFLRFEGKEIPLDMSRYDNPDYMAFLERIGLEHEKAEKKRNDRLMVIATLVGVVIALAAASAGLWSGYEAHQARIEDERPYVRVEFSGIKGEGFTIDSPNGGGESTWDTPAPHVTLDAFGKSPAVNVVVQGTCKPGSTPENFFPGANPTVFGIMFPQEKREAFCPQIIPELGKEPISLTYWGIVYYRDIQERRYQTPYCFTYVSSKPPSITNCEGYSDIK